MARTTLVDDEERGFETSDEPALDPLLDTQETAAKNASEGVARPSARALYVPSPLPMGELKKALAREAEEEATSAAPTVPPPRDDSPLVIETPHHVPLHAAVGHAPPPGLEKKIDQRFASMVDSEEARGIGATVEARAKAIAAARGIKANPQPLPLPSLDQFAPIVPIPAPAAIEPLTPVVDSKTAQKKPKRGKVRAVLAFVRAVFLFTFVLALGGAVIAAALGKLTMDNARNALTTVRGAAAQVAQVVKRL